jgi:hypothetical protein
MKVVDEWLSALDEEPSEEIKAAEEKWWEDVGGTGVFSKKISWLAKNAHFTICWTDAFGTYLDEDEVWEAEKKLMNIKE